MIKVKEDIMLILLCLFIGTLCMGATTQEQVELKMAIELSIEQVYECAGLTQSEMAYLETKRGHDALRAPLHEPVAQVSYVADGTIGKYLFDDSFLMRLNDAFKELDHIKSRNRISDEDYAQRCLMLAEGIRQHILVFEGECPNAEVLRESIGLLKVHSSVLGFSYEEFLNLQS